MSVIMLSVANTPFMLSVFMLNVVMLIVVMLNAVAPSMTLFVKLSKTFHL
jgi:hypothetical protein